MFHSVLSERVTTDVPERKNDFFSLGNSYTLFLLYRNLKKKMIVLFEIYEERMSLCS